MEIITPEENPDRHVGRKRTAEKQLLIISINFLAFFGFAIIAYGLAAQIYQETWGVLERIANFVSTTSTLLGALLTFLSVYLKPNARPPEAVSKKYVAPFCIFIVVATGVVLISNPQSVHPHVVNGIAILAIAGGLFRTVST
jgi:uncharacterized membrane protein